MDAQYIDNFTKSTNANLAKALRNFAQSANNTVAENVSVPVDAIAWALRKTGIPVNKPMLGSDWMREKGLTKDVEQGGAQLAGETVGMLSPLGFTKQGAQALIEGAGKLKNMPVGNMFIGQTANTWDEVAAAQAKMMEGQGKSAQEIWKETGTFKGPDGKYRQEIDDSLSRLDAPTLQHYQKAQANNPNRMDKVAGVLSHKPAYNAYPSIQDIGLDLTSTKHGGRYVEDTLTAPETIGLGQVPDSKSSLLHEMQHAIQQREGFARGGSPQAMAQDVFEAKENFAKYDGLRQQAYDAANQEAAWKVKDPAFAQIIQDEMAKHAKTLGVKSDANPFGVDEQQALAWYLANQKGAERYAALANKNRFLSKMDPEQAYKNLAGEAEARATQARMNMTAQERRELFPLDSYDVPINQLIVR